MRIRVYGSEASIHTRHWLALLERHQSDVELYSLTGAVTPSAKRGFARLLLRAWRSAVPDIAVIHTLGTHGLLGALAPRPRRVALVPWGSEVEAARNSALRKVAARFIMRRADVVVATSLATTQTLLDLSRNVPPVHTISWGVDVAAILAVDREQARRDVRNALGLPEGTMLVVAPRGLAPTYREELIEAAAELAAAARRDLHLVSIDAGLKGGSLGTARRLCEWHSRMGHLSKEDLYRLLRSSDVVVSGPITDQRSTTVLEALAAGATVVLNGLPAYREMVDDGATAVIIDDFSVPALAEALVSARPTWVRSNEAWAKATEDVQDQSAKLYRICVGGPGCV